MYRWRFLSIYINLWLKIKKSGHFHKFLNFVETYNDFKFDGCLNWKLKVLIWIFLWDNKILSKVFFFFFLKFLDSVKIIQFDRSLIKLAKKFFPSFKFLIKFNGSQISIYIIYTTFFPKIFISTQTIKNLIVYRSWR